jgi:hypothetical protein
MPLVTILVLDARARALKPETPDNSLNLRDYFSLVTHAVRRRWSASEKNNTPSPLGTPVSVSLSFSAQAGVFQTIFNVAPQKDVPSETLMNTAEHSPLCKPK